MVRKVSIFKRALLSSSSMELGVVFFFFFEEEDPRTSFPRAPKKKGDGKTTPDAAFFGGK